MPSFCTKCIRSESLISYIEERGATLHICPICNEKEVDSITASDPGFRSRFRSLIRFHYPEWDYNGKWGGVYLESLFMRENAITKYRDNHSEEALEEAIHEIIEPVYEDFDTGISLYSGDSDFPLRSLKDTTAELTELKNKSLETNYFLLEAEMKKYFSDSVEDLKSSVPANTSFYRARIGVAKSSFVMGSLDSDCFHYSPYEGSNIGAPPSYLASNGRMNRQGVSFLYLASNLKTSISEVRPHPGHMCSIGIFESIKEVVIADFTRIKVTDFHQSDKRLDLFMTISALENLFSMPITPETRKEDYHFTQLMADTFRLLKFDGIRFRSSVGTGTNLVIFDPSKFEYKNNSGSVYKVNSLEYGINEENLRDESRNYLD